MVKKKHVSLYDRYYCYSVTCLGKVAKKVIKNTFLTKKIFSGKDLYIFNKFDALDLNSNDLLSSVSSNTNINNVIWTGWLQGEAEMPKAVSYCLNSIETHSNNHPVVLITMNNLKKYLPDFPNIILEKYRQKKIVSAHFMDIVRVMLIRRYGGLWIDPTVLVTQDLDDAIFENDFYSYRGKSSPWGSNPANSKWCTFFMGGKKNNAFFRKIEIDILEYWKNSDYAIDYFLLDYIMEWIYIHDKSVQVVVNALKESEGTVFELVKILKKEYTIENFHEYKRLLKNEPIYKLSYKQKEMLYKKSLFSHLMSNDMQK